MRPAAYPTVIAALEVVVQSRRDDPCMVFVQGAEPDQSITYADLWTTLRHYADALLANGIRSGDLVMLAVNHTWELIPAFLSAIHLGAVPVILPYLDTLSGTVVQEQIQALIRTWQTRAIITLPQFESALAGFTAGVGCPIIVASLPAGEMEPPQCNPSPQADVAYLQLSSGTTSHPKATIITHRALLNSVQSMLDDWELTAQDVSVGWLPLHHDMGLIFEVLTPLLGGFLSVLIAPDYWVRRPRSLIQSVDRYRGTWTGMPNFAFNHCVRNIRDADIAGVDLSCWRLVLNGAELVYAESLQLFYERFAPYGLAHEALRTVYGMTENVGAISMTPPVPASQPWLVDWIAAVDLVEKGIAQPLDPADPKARAIADCGRLLPGNELVIVDEHGGSLPDRHAGEIWLRSHSLCPAYYEQEDGHIPNAKGWFATGDIGYLVDQRLFICDRKKDLIITAGNHIYPGTIERIGMEVLGEYAGGMAAFGVANSALGTELPVLVCEVRGRFDETMASTWTAAIRSRTHHELRLALADIQFVRRGWLVQTTSAKVSRSASREKYLAAGHRPTLPAQALLRAAARDPALLEQALTTLACQMFGVANLQPTDDLFAAGGDSLAIVRFVMTVEEHCGFRAPSEFFQDATIASLMALMAGQTRAATGAQQTAANTPAPSRARAKRTRGVMDVLHRHGPAIKQLSLPYGVGTRLQRWLFSQPDFQRRMFARSCAVFRTWLDATGQTGDADALLTRHLMANAWRPWRRVALSAPAQREKTIAVSGAEVLDGGRRAGRGVVLVMPHYADPTWIALTAQQHTPDLGVFRGAGRHATPEQRVRTHTAHFFDAIAVLRRGGCVIIAIDSTQGQRGIEVPFYGYKMPFRSGAAELAADTGASVVFATWLLGLDGRMTIDFHELPGSQRSEHEYVVEDLINQYARTMTDAWPALLPSISAGALYSNTVSLPRLDAQDGTPTAPVADLPCKVHPTGR